MTGVFFFFYEGGVKGRGSLRGLWKAEERGKFSPGMEKIAPGLGPLPCQVTSRCKAAGSRARWSRVYSVDTLRAEWNFILSTLSSSLLLVFFWNFMHYPLYIPRRCPCFCFLLFLPCLLSVFFFSVFFISSSLARLLLLYCPFFFITFPVFTLFCSLSQQFTFP